MPTRIARLSHRNTLRSLAVGLLFGLVGGVVAGVSAGVVAGLSAGVVAGVSVGLAGGLAGIAISGFARPTDVEDSALGPADVWRHDRKAGLVYALTSVLVIGLLGALTVRLVPGLAAGLVSRLPIVVPLGLLAGIVVGLAVAAVPKRPSSAMASPGLAAIATAAALGQLAIRQKIPLRLVPFLEDARSRHLLRTVGPVYQFRHATLQDRLAQPTPEDRPAS